MKWYNKVLLRSFVGAIVLISGFIGIALLLGDYRIAAFDNSITGWLNSLKSAPLTRIMTWFTIIGSGLPVMLIASGIALLFAYLGYRKELMIFAGVIFGSGLINLGLKLIFRRARPIVHRIIEANGYSYPSGHSMGAFTLYGITTFFLWKHLQGRLSRTVMVLLGIILTLMIGLSRIYLGVHYPSDVVGGYMASGAWLLITISCYQHFLEERWRSKKERTRA